MILLNIDDFMSTLPTSILSGDDIKIPDLFFRKIFTFSELNSNDIFYYLGIGNNYSSLLEATVIFTWFTDEQINQKLASKFKEELNDGAKIISIWSPPDMFIPDKVDFPLILCKKPFRYGNDIKDQLKSIYGNNCIDFTASWRLAEKY